MNELLSIKVSHSADEALVAERESHCRSLAAWNRWANGMFAFLAVLITAFTLTAYMAQGFHAKAAAQARTIRRQNAAIAYYVKGERFAAASALSGK